MFNIGIIGAMDIEIESLKLKMTDLKTTEIAHLTVYEGKINQLHITLVKSGIGKVNAALCAQLLITQFKTTHIINTGIAGSLSDELNIFDIVLSTKCVYHDADTTFFGDPACTIPNMPTYFEADKNLLDCASKASSLTNNKYSLYKGIITSGDVFVNSEKDKNLIKNKTNALCVEMEGCAIAHACYLYQIPFLIIRTISDSANGNDYLFNKETAAEISSTLVYNLLSNWR